MTEPHASVYHRHRFPAAIISKAEWLYFRFRLSFLMVEEVLLQSFQLSVSDVSITPFGCNFMERVRRFGFVYGHGRLPRACWSANFADQWH